PYSLPPTSYLSPLSLHDALPISLRATALPPRAHRRRVRARRHDPDTPRQPVRQREPPRHLPDARRQVDRALGLDARLGQGPEREDRKSTRLNSSHVAISYAVFCL